MLLLITSYVVADDHWAFRPLAPVEVPAIADAGQVNNPVNRFVVAKFEKAWIASFAAVNPAALLRRASFDLIGLPPSPQELVEKVEADPSESTWSKTIDRLLASPHFGERWGRHWLDQAGYVDVMGGDNDAATMKIGENKWLYRDYVVASLNADKPFDQFLTEQLAGDELLTGPPPPALRRKFASG